MILFNWGAIKKVGNALLKALLFLKEKKLLKGDGRPDIPGKERRLP